MTRTQTTPVSRPALATDLALVATWVRSAHECALWAGTRITFPVRPEVLATEIDFHRCDGRCLVEEGAAVAFGQIVRKGSRGHLARVIVSPAHRGRGIGERLVRELLRRARDSRYLVASLNVDPSNTAAIRLYSRLGFRDAVRPVDEPDPAGSRYMEQPLGQ